MIETNLMVSDRELLSVPSKNEAMSGHKCRKRDSVLQGRSIWYISKQIFVRLAILADWKN